MPNIIPFNFNNTDVRVIERDGEPWFVAADVCAILEIKNTSDAIKRLDADEVTLDQIEGSHRATNLVNESGLFALVLRSDKPQARPFRKWVTSEVLPSIRQTGGYTPSAQPVPDFLDPAAAARAWLQQYETAQYYKMSMDKALVAPTAEDALEEIERLKGELAKTKDQLAETRNKLKTEKARKPRIPHSGAAHQFLVDVQGMGPELIGAFATLTTLIYVSGGARIRDDRHLGGTMHCHILTARSLTDKLIDSGKITLTPDGRLTTNHAPTFNSQRSA